ncbi:GIY-YIG nuclease family protein [Thiorhodococcus mannitoliphagus]|uniref:GIY-YIG nuclease family protein n=1 Tax=Thiorhodococcus mannitoliphagus TaxID=329406 RepID=A0A6P1E118_9GAMM|nr:GIY-YIG nuclease family protein [Thiorhodococcus mannitoliphagus]NEX23490.1 GIY-YIG nuclease family protein [Thiorhodococcus mannitoliphagus]
MKLSERRDREFLEKKRRLFEREIRKQGGAKGVFEKFKNYPTDQALCDFLVEVNYGSCCELPVYLLGEAVAVEILEDAFAFGYQSTLKQSSSENLPIPSDPQDFYGHFISGNFIGAGYVYTELVMFEIHTHIEKKVLPLLDEGLISRFGKNEDKIDSQTGVAINFEYYGLSKNEDHLRNGYITPFMFRRDRAISLTQWIGLPSTFEELDRISNSARKEHGVTGHDRHYSSGKVVWVNPHKRRNPLGRSNDSVDASEDNYIVYLVYDSEGQLRYVGEGRPNRPEHVNSGASHNARINEYFYTRGPMKIRLLHEGLTKDYAKAIELYYIQKFKDQIWNIAENETVQTPYFETWKNYKLDLPVLEVLDEGRDYDLLLKEVCHSPEYWKKP